MNQTIYKKIKSLPPLDDTIVKIQKICVDEDSNISDLVKAVEQDPMLTANILKSANSPLYGFSREIQSISRAVGLFGMATIRGFALSSVLKKSISIDLQPYDISNRQFQDISTAQSILMTQWYGKIDKKMMDVLIPASFMMEIGIIILAHELIETNNAESFNEKVKECKTPKDLLELEKEFLDTTNEEVTAKIFEQWNLETEMVESIHYSAFPDDAPDHIREYAKALQIVKTAINIFGFATENNIDLTLPLLDEYNFDHAIFLEAAHKVAK